MRQALVAIVTTLTCACASSGLRMPPGADGRKFVVDREGSLELGSFRFRPEVCDGQDLRPDYGVLNEATFLAFLRRQGFSVEAQRQQVDPNRPELHYVYTSIPGFPEPVPLRIAVLPSADDAARSLHEAVLQFGPGSWGVHRSNLAVLGPKAPIEDAVAFAAMTKLACWGTFTVAGRDDDYVVPGAYMEP